MMIIAPEILTSVFIVLMLGLDLFSGQKAGKKTYGFTYIFFTILLLAFAVMWRREGIIFSGAYVADGVSWFSKIVIILAAVLTGMLSLDTVKLNNRHLGAYYALLLSSTLGMMFLVSSRELITLYVALETTTISLYGLAAIYKKDELSLEAGIKYLILGALSSGILLYGISIVYISTETTYLEGILAKVSTGSTTPYLTVGVIMILLGIGFKLSMVPMHVWTPDVYNGAPTPIAAFISVASKAAGFIFALRLFSYTFIKLDYIWVPVMAVLAVLTMTIGNLLAIPQKNIKRFLAYSTISQAGYILVGFVGASVIGMSSVIFYLLVYVFTNMTAFAVVVAFSNSTGSDWIEDYAGMAQKEPLLALAFLLSLLSLAGIPPLAGFVGKVYLFYAAMQKGYTWLVVIAALNSTISLYYYLLILKQMYIFDGAKEMRRITVPAALKAAILIMAVCIVLLGIFPAKFIDITTSISQKLFM